MKLCNHSPLMPPLARACVIRQQPAQAQPPNNTPSWTCRNSTDMGVIEKAGEYVKQREPGISWTYRSLSAKHDCSRSALPRRWRGIACARTDYEGTRRAIHLDQEAKLVPSMLGLTKEALSPTRQMVRSSGSEIAERGLRVLAMIKIRAFTDDSKAHYYLRTCFTSVAIACSTSPLP